jgi:hypothetical protein
MMSDGNGNHQLRKWTGHVAYIGVKRNAYKILVEHPEGKRSLARSSHRWEYNF